ncbi:hypothetical protein Leryth_025714 [Lithospermum erythrorhizon]|nr:hypothetical protein Leryth_025714 [Lithospermum erythrorhizon]
MDYYEGGGGGSVIVVEYLEPSMSKGLLTKFPDNSAFDFDYTQSSIWSPVVKRKFNATNSTFKATTFHALKSKFNAAVFDNFQQKINFNNKPNNALGFHYSQLSSSSQTPKGQGWGKVLKAAKKQFKKKKNKKREATNVQFYYSHYFSDWDF